MRRLLRASDSVLVVERVHAVHVRGHVRRLRLFVGEELAIDQGLCLTIFLLLRLHLLLLAMLVHRGLISEAIGVRAGTL